MPTGEEAPVTLADTKGIESGRGGGLRGVLRATGKNRSFLKKIGFGGGGMIAIIVALFLALIPLKIEALMKNIAEARITNKVDHMVEKRADKIVVRYLAEHTALAAAGGTYADASIIKTLYGNWKLGKFETKFFEQSGYKLEKIGRSGIRLSAPDGVNKDFTSETDFAKFVGDNKGLHARQLIRQVTRDQTKWYQIIKRHNLRVFMRNAYGIHKWTFFTGKKGKEADTEVQTSLIDSAAEPVDKTLPSEIDCALSGKGCPTDTGGPDTPYGNQDVAAPNTGTSGGDDAKLKSQVADALKTARDKAKALGPSELAKKGLTKVLSKILGEELAKSFSDKLVPIVGQILLVDQLARLDHFFTSGNADETLRAAHKVQYATAFAQWSTITDDSKDPNHKISLDEFNAVYKKLDGAEKSAAFNDLFLNKAGGTQLDPSLGINDTATPIKDDYNKYASTGGAGFVYPLRAWYFATENVPGLKAAIDLLNSALGAVASAAFSTIKFLVPPLGALLADLGNAATSQLMRIAPPAVDGTEQHAQLANGLDAGGAVVGQDFAYNLGGHTMPQHASLDLQSAIAQDGLESRPGLFDRIFSPNYSKSVVNQLAIAMPSSPGAALNQASGYTLAVMHNPFNLFGAISGLFSPGASAYQGHNLYGLKDIGMTEAELNRPIDTAGLNDATQKAADRLSKSFDEVAKDPSQVLPSDCANVPADQPNMCRLDLASIQSLNSRYTKLDDGGTSDESGQAGGSTPTPTTPGGDYIFPIDAPVGAPSTWTLDQGVDIFPTAGCGASAPEVAIADGTIVLEGVNGFGPDAPVLKASSGPFKDRYIYYGHALGNTVKVGDMVKAGQVITHVGCGSVGISSGPHIEIGVSEPGSSSPCCPAKFVTATEMKSYLEKAYAAGHK